MAEFETDCKYCGKAITMSDESGSWRPSQHDCPQPCKYCGEKIVWDRIDGKWVPYDLAGDRHNCSR